MRWPRGQLRWIAIAAASAAAAWAPGARAELHVRYYPTADYAESIAVGPDGALWVREFGDTIERVTLRGAHRVFRVRHVDPAGVSEIAAGPDGAMWFSEDRASCGGTRERFDRMTPTGRVTRFVIPRYRRQTSVSFAGPEQGPDGNLWFSAGLCRGGGLVGRITPAGQVKQWRIGMAPSVMARGPDGQMWFAAAYPTPRRALSVSASGKVTVHRLKLPLAVTRGPGGAFWAAVDRGVLRERLKGESRLFPYPAGDPTNSTDAAAPGPNGDVWFARENDDEELPSDAEAGVVDRRGHIETVPLGDGGGSPADITSAPDGSVWVAQFYGPLARISPSTSIRSRTPHFKTLRVTRAAQGATVDARCVGVLGTFCSATLTLLDRAGRLISAPRRFTVAAQDRLTARRTFLRPARGAVRATFRPRR